MDQHFVIVKELLVRFIFEERPVEAGNSFGPAGVRVESGSPSPSKESSGSEVTVTWFLVVRDVS